MKIWELITNEKKRRRGARNKYGKENIGKNQKGKDGKRGVRSKDEEWNGNEESKKETKKERQLKKVADARKRKK